MQKLILIFCALTISGCASLGKGSPLLPLERKMIYYPAPYPQGDWQPANLQYEEADFESADGTRIGGWFMDHPEPVAVALYLHGNAGNISTNASTLQILNQRHRLAVFGLDYRGYGKSEGKPCETGLLEDARAARKWLSQRKKIAESEIVLMGQSLGGAIAIDLAAKDGARGLVVASTFTSLPDVAKEIFPWLLPGLNMTQRLNSLAKIKDYQGPLLLGHGDADRTIPFSHGMKLFNAANEPKQMIVIRGGDHNSPMPEEWRQALDQFLQELPTSNR
jgi:fermentation-respiration switch protein FrsA (DUF1100 family)